jgi:4'-phosphopantetheinyl transferase
MRLQIKPGFGRVFSCAHGTIFSGPNSSMSMTNNCVACVSELGELRKELDARVNNLAWLTEHEEQRLAQIGSEQRRLQYLLGHYLVRQLAAYRQQNDFQQWRLQRNAQGQYMLTDGANYRLYASISHSGAWVAAAVAEVPIGIDIESLEQKQRNYLPIARHIFSKSELEQLIATEADQRSALFYTYWTIKEAAAKRSGQGLRSQVTRAAAAVEISTQDLCDFVTWQQNQFLVALTHNPALNYELHGLMAEKAITRYWRQQSSRG